MRDLFISIFETSGITLANILIVDLLPFKPLFLMLGLLNPFENDLGDKTCKSYNTREPIVIISSEETVFFFFF